MRSSDLIRQPRKQGQRRLARVLVLAFMLPLAAAARGETVTDLDGAFSVSPDGDWTRGPGRAGISLACTHSACGAETVVCTAHPSPEPKAVPGAQLPADEIRLYVEGVERTRPQDVRGETVAPMRPRTIGQIPGHWMELRVMRPSIPQRRITAFVFAVRGHAVVFNCYAPEPEWDLIYRTKVEKLLASIRVLP